MAGLSPILTKSFVAGGAIPARSIVKFGADDLTVVVAAAAADFSIGVTTDLAVVAGETVDVIVGGIGEAVASAVVTRGALLTSDAVGKAIVSAPAAGVNNRIVGEAFTSAVAGDIFPILISQGSLQG
jgi:hypothetical protein